MPLGQHSKSNESAAHATPPLFLGPAAAIAENPLTAETHPPYNQSSTKKPTQTAKSCGYPSRAGLPVRLPFGHPDIVILFRRRPTLPASTAQKCFPLVGQPFQSLPFSALIKYPSSKGLVRNIYNFNVL
jgi:hypothetical protein